MMPHRLFSHFLPEIFSAATGTTIAVYAQVFDPQSGVPTTIGIGTVCGILLWSFIRRTETDQKTITALLDEKKAMFEAAIDGQKQHTAAVVALTERIMASEAEQRRLFDGILESQVEMRNILAEVARRPCQLPGQLQRQGDAQ